MDIIKYSLSIINRNAVKPLIVPILNTSAKFIDMIPIIDDNI